MAFLLVFLELVVHVYTIPHFKLHSMHNVTCNFTWQFWDESFFKLVNEIYPKATWSCFLLLCLGFNALKIGA